MRHADCCERGRHSVFKYDEQDDWNCYTPDGDYTSWVRFCPFCGHDLSVPANKCLSDALFSLLTSPPVTICFDVDGVLCDDRDPGVPYAQRRPYPWVADTLRRLKELGHTIHVQTARYMKKLDGDQLAVLQSEAGSELRWWLRCHNIPYDRVYVGKCSADVYVDDRACRVASNRGTTDWCDSLVPTISRTQCPATSTAATSAATRTTTFSGFLSPPSASAHPASA